METLLTRRGLAALIVLALVVGAALPSGGHAPPSKRCFSNCCSARRKPAFGFTIVRARSETAMDGPGMKHCRPERSGTVCFTFYMRVRENRSPRSRPGRWPTPVLVGTGTSARTATRGYCTELQLRMESKMECYHVARPRPESPHTS